VGDYGITVSSGADDNYNFIYVSGTLSVISSFPPGINDLQIATNEDSRFVFNYELFSQHFWGTLATPLLLLKLFSLLPTAFCSGLARRSHRGIKSPLSMAS